jgi:phosphotriesterase-related protein
MPSDSKRPESSVSSVISRRAFTTGLLAGSALFALASRTGMATVATVLPRTKKSKSLAVSTMNGPVSCGSLGTTLMHEHVLWFSGPRLDNPGYTPIPDNLRSDTVDFAVSLLNAASRAGIDTVVDLTPHRPIDLYEEIAKRTPVKIVASTGFYRREKIPKPMADMEDERQMEERMLNEVTEGIDRTKVRAGIIKVAGERASLSDWEKKVFRAAARVQKTTGVPIATHDGAGAREQFDLLVRAGANPNRLFLSHVDTMLHGGRTREQVKEELLSIAKEGGYLEVDTFGQEFYTPWSDLVFFLRSLCDAGFANRIFISIDCNWHWGNQEKVFEGAEEPYFDPDASKRTYAYMVTDAVPKLLKSGFSKKEIDTFLVDNPRRFFCGL